MSGNDKVERSKWFDTNVDAQLIRKVLNLYKCNGDGKLLVNTYSKLDGNRTQ
jgi:hypothetical protein